MDVFKPDGGATPLVALQAMVGGAEVLSVQDGGRWRVRDVEVLRWHLTFGWESQVNFSPQRWLEFMQHTYRVVQAFPSDVAPWEAMRYSGMGYEVRCKGAGGEWGPWQLAHEIWEFKQPRNYQASLPQDEINKREVDTNEV